MVHEMKQKWGFKYYFLKLLEISGKKKKDKVKG